MLYLCVEFRRHFGVWLSVFVFYAQRNRKKNVCDNAHTSWVLFNIPFLFRQSHPVPEIKQKKNPTVIGFVFFSCGGDEVGGRSKQRLRNSEVSEFTRINDRLRSTICCKQQCYAFVREIAESLAMSAALDFRKCKRLLLSSLAVSRGTGVHRATPCCDFSKSQ